MNPFSVAWHLDGEGLNEQTSSNTASSLKGKRMSVFIPPSIVSRDGGPPTRSPCVASGRLQISASNTRERHGWCNPLVKAVRTVALLASGIVAAHFGSAANGQSTSLSTKHFEIDYSSVPVAERERVDAITVRTASPKAPIDCNSTVTDGKNRVYDIAELSGMYLEWARQHYLNANYPVPTKDQIDVIIEAGGKGTDLSGRFDDYGVVRQLKIYYDKVEDGTNWRIAGTCFHELFHAVQERWLTWPVGAYSKWLTEGTARYFEGVLCDTYIHVGSGMYYRNCRQHFYHPDKCVFWKSQEGYGTALFWSYLQDQGKKRGQDVIRGFFKNGGTLLDEQSLVTYVETVTGRSFQQLLREFAAANYCFAKGRPFSRGYRLYGQHSDFIFPAWKLPFQTVSSPGIVNGTVERHGASYLQVSNDWRAGVTIRVEETLDADFVFDVYTNSGGDDPVKTLKDLGDSCYLTREEAPDAFVVVTNFFHGSWAIPEGDKFSLMFEKTGKEGGQESLWVYVHETGSPNLPMVASAVVEGYPGRLTEFQAPGSSSDETAKRMRRSGRNPLRGDTGRGELAGLCRFENVKPGYYVVLVTHPEYNTWVGEVEVKPAGPTSGSDTRLRVMLTPRDSAKEEPDEAPSLPGLYEHPNTPSMPSATQGILDLVLCIDRSGSMSDDIEMVQEQVDTILGELGGLGTQLNISMQVGVVLFHSDADGTNHFDEVVMTTDIESIRQYVRGLDPTAVGGDENLFAAMMYAMREPVDGNSIEMGWRQGAAKIAFPITDEIPKSEPFTFDQVVERTINLDPVHVYPLIMPKPGSMWLDPAVRSMEKLAAATGGEAVRVNSAGELPHAIVDTVKLAIRRHKEEIWRKENPPYVLYGVGSGIGAIVVLGLVVLLVRGRRRVAVAAAASTGTTDPRLTGQAEPPTPPKQQPESKPSPDRRLTGDFGAPPDTDPREDV